MFVGLILICFAQTTISSFFNLHWLVQFVNRIKIAFPLTFPMKPLQLAFILPFSKKTWGKWEDKFSTTIYPPIFKKKHWENGRINFQLPFILPFSKKHWENGRINFQLPFILQFYSPLKNHSDPALAPASWALSEGPSRTNSSCTWRANGPVLPKVLGMTWFNQQTLGFIHFFLNIWFCFT